MKSALTDYGFSTIGIIVLLSAIEWLSKLTMHFSPEIAFGVNLLVLAAVLTIYVWCVRGVA